MVGELAVTFGDTGDPEPMWRQLLVPIPIFGHCSLETLESLLVPLETRSLCLSLVSLYSKHDKSGYIDHTKYTWYTKPWILKSYCHHRTRARKLARPVEKWRGVQSRAAQRRGEERRGEEPVGIDSNARATRPLALQPEPATHEQQR